MPASLRPPGPSLPEMAWVAAIPGRGETASSRAPIYTSGRIGPTSIGSSAKGSDPNRTVLKTEGRVYRSRGFESHLLR